MGKRLFIAVDIDEATRVQVGRISARLRDAIGTPARASWVRPERMHLTLLFCGDADAAVEARWRAALARPMPQVAFDVSFDRVGCFPKRGAPRVLWLGVAAGLEPLRRLYAAFAGLDPGRGLPGPTIESFTPHLTLARFRDRVSRANISKITVIPASAGPSRIDRVTLYESRLSPSLDLRSGRPEAAGRAAGPAYVPLAEAPLQP